MSKLAIDCGTHFIEKAGACVPRPEALPDTIFSDKESFTEIVLTILNYAFAIAGIVAVIFIIIGGYQYLTAGGDEEQTKQARKYIVNSLIGLVIVLVGAVLVRLVTNLIAGGEI